MVIVNRSAILSDDRFIEWIQKTKYINNNMDNVNMDLLKNIFMARVVYLRAYYVCIYNLKFKCCVYYKHIKIKNIE